MPILTHELIESVGISLSDEDYEMLRDHIEETLQDRVIDEIVRSLSPEKAEELASLKGSVTDEQVFEWMQQNVPDLADIVSDEVDILLGEIAENGDAISSDNA